MFVRRFINVALTVIMAFPFIAATATTNGTTASSTPVINLPAGIAQGDLMLVLVRMASTGTPLSQFFPIGWSKLFDSIADASDDYTVCGFKEAEIGDVGATTISCNHDVSAKFAALAWRITGHVSDLIQDPEFAALVTGTGTTPNPGLLTPTPPGSAKDYLWIWIGGWEGEQTSPPAGNPTNYTLNKIGANSGTAGVVATNCRVASAARQLNAASEDPPSWTISVSDDWTATVIAIHPASPPVIRPPKPTVREFATARSTFY